MTSSGNRGSFFSSPTLRPLKGRDFRLVWSGALVSNIGTWMETTALSTLVASETRSATQVAFTAMAGFLPSAFASPIGGVLADRFDRRKFLQVSIVLETLFAALLALLVGVGVRSTAPLAAIVFLASIVSSAALPNRQAVLPSLVSQEDLPAAISLGSASWNGGRVFGPVFASLVTIVGPTWAFVINALSFVPILFAWRTITLPPLAENANKNAGLGILLREGFALVKQDRQLRFAVAFIFAMAGSAGPFIGLLAIMARVRFDISAALFVSAQGLGAVLGALATTRLTAKLGRRGVMLFAVSLLPLGLLAYAYAPNKWVAAVAVLIVGGAYMGAFACAQAILQLNSPPALRARVLALFSVSLGASYCGGLLIGGPLADRTSVQAATVFQAAATVAAMAILTIAFPRWWKEPKTI